MDGSHSLQDAPAEKRRHGDGVACVGLQYDPRHESDGYPGDDRSDEGLKGSVRPEISRENAGMSQKLPQSPSQPIKTVELMMSRKNARKHRKLTSTNDEQSFHTASGLCCLSVGRAKCPLSLDRGLLDYSCGTGSLRASY